MSSIADTIWEAAMEARHAERHHEKDSPTWKGLEPRIKRGPACDIQVEVDGVTYTARERMADTLGVAIARMAGLPTTDTSALLIRVDGVATRHDIRIESLGR